MRDAMQPASHITSRMELRHIRYFVMLADVKSFTRAAERLHITQPTLSHQMKQLEQVLGTQLFKRNTRELTLTEAGETFRPHCDRILLELEAAALALSGLTGLVSGTLRLAVSHSFSNTMLPLALSEFAARYPAVHVIAKLVPRADLQRELLEGDLDLAVAYLLEDTEHFESDILSEEVLVLVVGKDHPLAERDRLTMAELAALPLVLLTPEFAVRQFLDGFFAERRLQPHIVLEMNAIEPILGMTRLSHLGTVISNGAISDATGLRIIPLTDPVPQRVIGILWRRNGHRSPAAQRLAEIIQANCRAANSTKISRAGVGE